MTIILIALGLSMDAFAVSVCIGLAAETKTVKRALITGLYFGVFQALMPLAGYLLATRFAGKIEAFDHWIAFGLLCVIGGKMIAGSLKPNGTGISEGAASLKPSAMFPLAVATSIDALAVGITFAFLRVEIVPAVLEIGGITLILSMLGVKIGSAFGVKFGAKAEIIGGVILILIGVKILGEHLV